MGKILEVFGKESGIMPPDIQKKLVEERLEKSAAIEYKLVTKKTSSEEGHEDKLPESQRSLSDKLKEDLVLKPIIAFLNSIGRQSALLVLGVETKGTLAVDTVPFPVDLLSEDKIRGWVNNYFGSLPEIPASPKLKIVQVDYPHDKRVIIIEVNPLEEVVYFSKLENRCYVRRSAESIDLPLVDFYAMVETQSIPLTYLRIESHPEGKTEEGILKKFRLSALFVNRGSRPAKDVVSTISIGARNCDAGRVTFVVDKSHFTDISEFNPGHLRTYQIKSADILYPGINTLIDRISVGLPTGGVLTVMSRTCDSAGMSRQYWEMNDSGAIVEMHTDHRRWGQAKSAKEEPSGRETSSAGANGIPSGPANSPPGSHD
jgi:hypothetical protein